MFSSVLFYDLRQFLAGQLRFNYVNFYLNLKLVLPIANGKIKSKRTINYGLSKDSSAETF
ncbi:hypothetical protein EXA23_08425 [Vibrio cincinnatiensis]|nr:hypothetical protein [Vibrio cincinnatiensis]